MFDPSQVMLTGTPTIAVSDALGAIARLRVKHPNDVAAYVKTLWTVAPLANLNPFVLMSQSSEETDKWVSTVWDGLRNPAGMKTVTGNVYLHFLNGEDAAIAQIMQMCAYVYGQVPPKLAGYDKPPRFDIAVRLFGGTVKTLSHLGGGKWAEDTEYPDKIADHMDYLYDLAGKGTPMGLVFGNVKHPPFVDRLVKDTENNKWNDLGKRNPVGVCQHSMIGTLRGTDAYFRRGTDSTGLTDYGIGNDSDGTLNGVIYRWNDPLGLPHDDISPNKAGWANGGSDGLEGDGPLFVRTLGIAAINRDLVSIERSDGGNLNTPMSPAQFEAICRLTAYWFDYAKVPYTEFPYNPHTKCVTHMLHKEFATKDCPFPPVYNRIDEIQNRVRGIMHAGQVPKETPDFSLPPVHPPKPDHEKWPHDWELDALRKRFGKIPRRDMKGFLVGNGRFSPTGAISNAWVYRGFAEGMTKVDQLPVPRYWLLQYEKDTQETRKPEIVLFDAKGGKDWVLYRPDTGVSWLWIA